MVSLRKKLFSQVQSGQAIVLIALAMIAILALAILAIDGGRFYSQRRINQNAADAGSLAGIYYFSSYPTTRSGATAWNYIKDAAQKNGIVDPASNTSDGRRVVQAFWLTKDGVPTATNSEFTDATSSPAYRNTVPSDAYAIRVTTRIEYDTFMLGILGQKRLTAEASSVARESVVVQPPPLSVFPYAGYFGGVGCDNGSGNTNNMKYALEVFSGNNTGFKGDLYIHGNAGFFSGNRVDMHDHKVTIWNYVDVLDSNGNNAQIVHQDPSNVEPGLFFQGSTNTVTVYTAPPYSGPPFPDNPTGPTNGPGTSPADKNDPAWKTAYPSVLYAPGESHPLDASDFEPPHGAVTGGYMYTNWHILHPEDDSKWHYIANQGSAAANGAKIGTLGAGVYYIDGDVSLGNITTTTGISVISTGKVDFSFNNNEHFGSAGDMAANISVLAGYYPDNNSRCANSVANTSNWVFKTDANQSYYDGFIYAPYGMVLFKGNGNVGHTQAWGVFANSLRIGDGSNNTDGNNMQFDFQQQLTLPIPTSGLMGNGGG